MLAENTHTPTANIMVDAQADSDDVDLRWIADQGGIPYLDTTLYPDDVELIVQWWCIYDGRSHKHALREDTVLELSYFRNAVACHTALWKAGVATWPTAFGRGVLLSGVSWCIIFEHFTTVQCEGRPTTMFDTSATLADLARFCMLFPAAALSKLDQQLLHRPSELVERAKE